MSRVNRKTASRCPKHGVSGMQKQRTQMLVLLLGCQISISPGCTSYFVSRQLAFGPKRESPSPRNVRSWRWATSHRGMRLPHSLLTILTTSRTDFVQSTQTGEAVQVRAMSDAATNLHVRSRLSTVLAGERGSLAQTPTTKS
jgi:hypothetical protein